MNNRDARKLSPEAQFEVRRRAVQLYESHHKIVEIARLIEVDRNTVGEWLRRYRKGGLEALEPRKRGPRKSPTKQLDDQQEALLKKLLIDKTPDQLRLPFALWTREAVRDLIKERTHKELDFRQVGRYLRRWGFTPQRPVKRAYQRDDAKVKKWLKQEYPTIKEKAENEGGEIHWTDETGIKSHDHRGRGYAPKGKTPVRLHNPNGEKINTISSVTNQGKLRFICYEGNFNYRMFHRFLKALVEDADEKKVFVIVDNLRVHHSKVIKRWVRRYSDLIEIHYLPSYSPDLNPDEYLNCDLKVELAKRPERRKKGNWKPTVESTLYELQNNPDRIRSYFQASSIKYAA